MNLQNQNSNKPYQGSNARNQDSIMKVKFEKTGATENVHRL